MAVRTLDLPPQARSEPPPTAPALRALVLYLRPAPRAELLAALAHLGVLVTEHQGVEGAIELTASSGADLALLVGAPRPEDLELIRQLARAFPARVVAVMPASSPLDVASAAGAALVVQDTDVGLGLPARLLPIAHRSRAARSRAASERQPQVFGVLEFHTSPPHLRKGLRTLPLSRSEAEVLRRLASQVGRPVPHIELEEACREVTGDVHNGFLKAVILRLRRKALELGGDPALLRTIRSFGYVLVG